MDQRNIRTLQIGKNTATAALASAAEVNVSTLLDGDIIPVDAATGKAIVSGDVATTAKIAFIQKGTSNYISNPIVVKNITSAKKAAYAAPTFTKKTIGYNGTLGSFPAQNDTSHSVKIKSNFVKDTADYIKGYNAVGTSKKYASAVQFQICKEIADSYNVNALFNETYVYGAVLQAAVPAVAGSVIAVPAGTTFDVTKGSPYIQFASDPTNAAVIPGATIAIPDSNWADKATYYKIKNVNAATYIVEVEGVYVGSTETGIAIADARIIPEGTEATVTGNCGIVFEAVTPPYKRNDKQFDIVMFEVEGDETLRGQSVAVTTLLNGSFGQGDGRIVADVEAMTRGNQIMNASEDDKFAYIKSDAVLTETYDVWVIEHADTSYTSVSTYSYSPIQTMIALPTTRTADKTADRTQEVLDAIAAL